MTEKQAEILFRKIEKTMRPKYKINAIVFSDSFPNNNDVAFNDVFDDLIFVKKSILTEYPREYVIATFIHELLHQKYLDHSKAFYKDLTRWLNKLKRLK
jgi:hypothetical protein